MENIIDEVIDVWKGNLVTKDGVNYYSENVVKGMLKELLIKFLQYKMYPYKEE